MSLSAGTRLGPYEIVSFEKTPGFGHGHIPLWAALDHLGRYDEALVALKAYYATEQAAPEIVKALERGNTEGGYKAALKRVAQALEARSRSTSVGAINVVNMYDRAGDLDKALEWLTRAYEWHDPNMAYISVIPFSDSLRKHPRSQDLLRRMDHGVFLAVRVVTSFSPVAVLRSS